MLGFRGGVLIVCATLTFSPATTAWAQDTPFAPVEAVGTTETPTPEPSPAPEDEHPIVPLLVNEPAPWSGLLVPEATFTEYLQLDLKVQELQGILDIRTSLLEEQRNIYETAMRQTFAGETSWWDDNGFTVGLVVGIVVGVGLTVLGAWAVGQM